MKHIGSNGHVSPGDVQQTSMEDIEKCLVRSAVRGLME